VLSIAIVPWELQAKATTFLGFLSGFPIFLGSILGVLSVDYWVFRRGKGFNLYHLYKPNGIYWYRGGVHWRALVAFCVGWVPQFPGLLQSIGVSNISVGMMYFYSFSWLNTVVFSAVAYYVLGLISPFVVESEEPDKGMYLLEGLDAMPTDEEKEKLPETKAAVYELAV